MLCIARLGRIVTQRGVAIISMARRPPLSVLAPTRFAASPWAYVRLSIPTFLDRCEKERPLQNLLHLIKYYSLNVMYRGSREVLPRTFSY